MAEDARVEDGYEADTGRSCSCLDVRKPEESVYDIVAARGTSRTVVGSERGERDQ